MSTGNRSDNAPLRSLVAASLDRYFEDLNGQPPSELYEFVLSEVERPLFEKVMREARGNVTRAAQMLGINRATLRTRLAKYGLNGK